MDIVNTLTPLFLIIFLGAVLRWRGFATAELYREINRLVFYVGLPAMLFYKTAQARVPGDAALRLSGVLLGAMLLCVGFGYVVGFLLRVPGRGLGAFVQGAYRSNVAYVGLAVVLFGLVAADGKLDLQIEALAVVALGALVPAYSLVAVLVLLIGGDHERVQRRRWLRELLRKIVTNPLVVACAAGIAYSLTGWSLPTMVQRTCATVGQIALPLALLGIGGSLRLDALQSEWRHSVAASLIKVAFAPLAGLLIAGWVGLAPAELRIAMIYLASPTAVASFVMAQQMGGDDELAGSIVLVSTLLSIPSLTLALLLT